MPPVRRLVIALLALGVAISALAASPARAQQAAPVAVIEVSGLIDRVMVDFIERSLRDAERARRQALVIQLNSRGSVVSAGRLERLVRRVAGSPVPVGVWVGPSGARAYEEAVELVFAADAYGKSPGSHIGSRVFVNVATPTPVQAPTLGDFIIGLDGLTLQGRTLHTAKVVEKGGQPRREPAVRVVFAKTDLVARLLHTVASPAVAYLLLLAGLLLIAFEFYSIGIGLAGLTGAGCLVLASYGLAVLPARWWAVGLLALAMFGFCVDVQAGTPRAWTVIGTVALVVGSLALYGGSGVDLRWPALLLGVLGTLLFMLAAMPSMLRARFGTPTIGRESMIGESGRATAGLNPDGMVQVRGALWRARTNRATPITEGDAIRVVGIEGLVLQVERAEPE